ncbi:MAG: flagellar protein FlaG [Lachnospiraceae bacterium]
MALESVSRTAGAAYQSSAPAVQTRHVEAPQPVAEAQPVVQQSYQSKSPENGGDKTREQNVELDNKKVQNAVADLNKKMNNTFCQYGIHEGTGRVTIKILDKETKDVIKEFPAEETLDLIEKVWELAGIMVDKKL